MQRNAFTLIELLVVIAITGLLTTIAVASLSSSREKASIAGGLQFERSIHNGLGAEAVAILDFDDGTGLTAIDSSGNNKNGILVNGPVWRCATTDKTFTPSGQGCSIYFDGADDYVSSTISGVGDGTISIWFKDQSSVHADLLMGKRTGGCFGTGIYLDPPSSSLRIYIAGPETEIGKYTKNTWNHLAVVRSGSGTSAKFYINGRLTLSNSYTLNLNDLITTIGASCGGVNSFNGYIDNVRIFSQSLGASAVNNLYVKELTKYPNL